MEPRLEPSAPARLVSTILALIGALTIGIALDRGPLRLDVRSSPSAWFSPTPFVGILRIFRGILVVGAAGLLVWLVVLMLLTLTIGRTRPTAVRRLPLGALVVRGLAALLSVSVAASTGAVAAPRSSSVSVVSDASGGQRWPVLPSTRAPRTIPAAVFDSPALPPSSTEVAQTTSAPTTAVASMGLPPTVAAGSDRATSSTPAPSRPHREAPASTWLADPTASSSAVPVSGPKLSPEPTAVGLSTGSTRYLVQSGDSFWTIAENHVLSTVPEATEQTIATYWLRLIDTNRALLTDPSNPDLLYVGTPLTLPPTVL